MSRLCQLAGRSACRHTKFQLSHITSSSVPDLHRTLVNYPAIFQILLIRHRCSLEMDKRCGIATESNRKGAAELPTLPTRTKGVIEIRVRSPFHVSKRCGVAFRAPVWGTAPHWRFDGSLRVCGDKSREIHNSRTKNLSTLPLSSCVRSVAVLLPSWLRLYRRFPP